MKIIYASCLVSATKSRKIWGKTEAYEGYQVQKFHRLLSEGFYLNQCEVNILSVLPVTRQNSPRKFFKGECETVENIKYIYPSIINIPGIKHIFSIILTLVHTCKLINKNKKTFIIADCLNQSAALGSVLAAKIMKIPSVGIVTDLPDFLGGKKNHINNQILGMFDKYILLTDEMNTYIKNNITHKGKPYIVIEGMVDEKVCDIQMAESNSKYKKRICMYAGTLDKQYGLGDLVKGFIEADIPETELHIYGNGNYREKLMQICRDNKNIRYFGTRPNSFIVKEQQKVDLLVNPRPSTAEFTKYSFPSKNMEYMASGTPMLTTKLPGMPKEYLQYVYFFQDESISGIAEELKKTLLLPEEELRRKGKEAQRFVMREKTARMQAAKIIDWLCSEKKSNKEK